MKISILTLFPQMFQGVFSYSIIKRAREKELLEIEFINIRDFGIGKHKIVDDKPYGGGVGMVMRVDVIAKAVSAAICSTKSKKHKELVILLDPQGKQFNQSVAKKITKVDHIMLICGRYEGVDDRVRSMIDLEISIGDYVLGGGEIPAMVVVDTVTRLIPGVLGKDESSLYESFQEVYLEDKNKKVKLLEYPQFTKPKVFENQAVPDLLFSGNHAQIAAWRKSEALLRTKQNRSDLL